MNRGDDIDPSAGVNRCRRGSAVLVIFPGALGDFLCLLPTLVALHDSGARLVLAARAAALEVVDLPGLAKLSIDRIEISDLFHESAAPRASTLALCANVDLALSWSGAAVAAVARRLSAAGCRTVRVFPFRGMAAGEHAVDYYARCAVVRPAATIAAAIARDDDGMASALRRHHIAPRSYAVVHPGSGAARKNWHGFADLMRRWSAEMPALPLVTVRGPADGPPPGNLAGPTFEDLSLPRLASLLHDARLYLGNDSGVSHLAGAVGAPSVVLFDRSDAVTWRPRASRSEVVQAGSCGECSVDAFCCHRLGVETVLAAARRCLKATAA